MISSQLTPTRARPTRSTRFAVVLLAAVLLAAVAAGVVAFTPFDPGRGAVAPHHSAPPASPRVSMVPATHDAGSSATQPRGIPTAVPGEGTGGGGGTVFDDGSATVANLDPDLLAALRSAATEALDDGIELHVNSGWRSAAYQEQLLEQAIAEYGSEKEARRWVATPETSEHVSGDAVDLGPTKAASWLERHGAAFGLCRVYRNEPWHFELRQGAALDGCPAMYADPTQDPRMSR
jgi:D-alanyl-D-alanine carboxypeptidase